MHEATQSSVSRTVSRALGLTLKFSFSYKQVALCGVKLALKAGFRFDDLAHNINK